MAVAVGRLVAAATTAVAKKGIEQDRSCNNGGHGNGKPSARVAARPTQTFHLFSPKTGEFTASA